MEFDETGGSVRGGIPELVFGIRRSVIETVGSENQTYLIINNAGKDVRGNWKGWKIEEERI